MFYVHIIGNEVRSTRRPHGETVETRQLAHGVDISRVESGERPTLHGYFRAYEDSDGRWRLDGSNRAVTNTR